MAITGGAGILGSEIASALAGCGAQVAILDVNPEAGKAAVERMGEHGKQVSVFQCDVLNRDSVAQTAQEVVGRLGKLDCLVNGAGGNKPQATTSSELKFFDLPADALRWVFELNILGTILPSQAFGKIMAAQGYGTIVNISSMNSFRPLTRIPAYSAAKAAVSNFTQWLAVHMAQEYSPKIRVNADRAGILPHQSESLPAARQRDRRADRARQVDHRAHADGAFRRAVRPVRRGALAALAGFGVRHWRSHSHRRRILGVQRRLKNRSARQSRYRRILTKAKRLNAPKTASNATRQSRHS